MSKEDRDDAARARGTTPVGYLDERSGSPRPLEGGPRGPFVHSVAEAQARRPFKYRRTAGADEADVREVTGFDSLLVNEPIYTLPLDVEPYSTMVVYAAFTPETVDDYLIFILQVANQQVPRLGAAAGGLPEEFHTYPLSVDELTQRPLLGQGGLGLFDKDLYISRTFHPVVYRTPRPAAGTTGGVGLAEVRLAIPFDVTPFQAVRIPFAVENDDGAGAISRGNGTVSLSYALGVG